MCRISALVVDDEKINTRIFEKLLSGFGVETVCASGGAEALLICEERQFDCVFLDLKMPGLSGYETLERLNKIFIEWKRKVPVICITAMSEEDEREKILNEGFSDIISKPVNREELQKVLNKYSPEEESVSLEEGDEESDEDLPEAVKGIPGLDYEHGIDYCGSVGDFLETLKIFGSSIDKKAANMDEYYKKGYIEELGMAAHSLKSTAGAAGAKQISQMAKTLEKACIDNDLPVIHDLTPEFLDRYRELGEELKKIDERDNEGPDKRPVSDKELWDAFNTIKELSGFYDSKSIDMVLDSVKSHSMPAAWRSLFDVVGEALGNMDWESIRKLMDDFEKE